MLENGRHLVAICVEKLDNNVHHILVTWINGDHGMEW